MAIVNDVRNDLNIPGEEPSIGATRGLIAARKYLSVEENLPSQVTGAQAYTIRDMRTRLIKMAGGSLKPNQSTVLIRFKNTSETQDTVIMYIKEESAPEA
jgi:hypothetical protein